MGRDLDRIRAKEGREPLASSILTTHKSCNLIPPMGGTRQNWNLVWQGSFLTTTPPPWPTCIPLVVQNWSWARCGNHKGSGRTPVLMPSSNSILAIASITRSATSPSFSIYGVLFFPKIGHYFWTFFIAIHLNPLLTFNQMRRSDQTWRRWHSRNSYNWSSC